MDRQTVRREKKNGKPNAEYGIRKDTDPDGLQEKKEEKIRKEDPGVQGRRIGKKVEIKKGPDNRS